LYDLIVDEDKITDTPYTIYSGIEAVFGWANICNRCKRQYGDQQYSQTNKQFDW
jgi:hypothetical protein